MEGADTIGELLTAEAIQAIEEKFDCRFRGDGHRVHAVAGIPTENAQSAIFDMDEAIVIDEPVTAKFEKLRRG